MATRSKVVEELVELPENLPSPEKSTRIAYIGDYIAVTHNRKYTFQGVSFEPSVVNDTITVYVQVDTDMVELGQQLQDEMDSLQSPDLNRIADAMDKNKTHNKNSFIYSLLSD